MEGGVSTDGQTLFWIDPDLHCRQVTGPCLREIEVQDGMHTDISATVEKRVDGPDIDRKNVLWHK